MTRVEAAHTNGALSHGPVTAEGKARSSKNAMKHGMNSRDVVLPGESQEDFDALLTAFVRSHKPVDDIERSFVFEMAACRWRLRRLAAMETAVFDQEMERVLNDGEAPVAPEYVLAVAFDRLAHGKALSNIHRYENRLRKAYDNALSELNDRQFERMQNEPDDAEEDDAEEQDQSDAGSVAVLNELVGRQPAGLRREPFLNACIESLALSAEAARAGAV
jgi:hypothetical protein